MNTIINGQLEIQHDRGVIYFHVDPDDIKEGDFNTPVVLKIAGLPQPIPAVQDRMLEVVICEDGPGAGNYDPSKEAKRKVVTCDWKGK